MHVNSRDPHDPRAQLFAGPLLSKFIGPICLRRSRKKDFNMTSRGPTSQFSFARVIVKTILRPGVITVFTLAAILPTFGLTGHAESLRFAWPDGASAKVQTRSQGHRTTKSDEKRAWDMSADFTMRIKRSGERVVVVREGFSGWKGTFPRSFGGGAERFVDMIPTLIASPAGEFIGIEGQETARKLMTSSVEQSGGVDSKARTVFESITSDAGLRGIASDHWSILVNLWEQVELDPAAYYEIRTVAQVPQLGGGEIELTGKIEFVKEIPCSQGPGDRRCVQLRAETKPDEKQVKTILESLLKKADAGQPKITLFDQQFKVDIIVEKKTMLPQQLTITRLHTFDLEMQGIKDGLTEEITKTYSFAWTMPEK